MLKSRELVVGLGRIDGGFGIGGSDAGLGI